MKATRRLHDAGQSIWLDDITRGLLTQRRRREGAARGRGAPDRKAA
jgi:hypothetical protein